MGSRLPMLREVRADVHVQKVFRCSQDGAND